MNNGLRWGSLGMPIVNRDSVLYMKRVVTFGEIMLRLATPGFERFTQSKSYQATFGGGEANVAVSLAGFGIPAEFVTRLPENDIARSCVAGLRSLGVETDRILYGGDRMGLYFLETGACARGSKVIYDREHSAMAEIRPGMIDWHAVLKDAGWFHWSGITPAISQDAADACMEAIRVANELGITVSADLNYRKNLWKYGKEAAEVLPDLVSQSDVLIAGEKDAEIIFGVEADVQTGSARERFRSVARKMMDHYPHLHKVVTTFRGAINANYNTWEASLFDGTRLYNSRKYELTHIVDRIGGGDSFMAGLIYGWLTYGGDEQRTLEYAVAASALKHTIFGDYNLVTVNEVETLMKGDGSGRVSR